MSTWAWENADPCSSSSHEGTISTCSWTPELLRESQHHRDQGILRRTSARRHGESFTGRLSVFKLVNQYPAGRPASGWVGWVGAARCKWLTVASPGPPRCWCGGCEWDPGWLRWCQLHRVWPLEADQQKKTNNQSSTKMKGNQGITRDKRTSVCKFAHFKVTQSCEIREQEWARPNWLTNSCRRCQPKSVFIVQHHAWERRKREDECVLDLWWKGDISAAQFS